jgi:hypothetical protein
MRYLLLFLLIIVVTIFLIKLSNVNVPSNKDTIIAKVKNDATKKLDKFKEDTTPMVK